MKFFSAACPLSVASSLVTFVLTASTGKSNDLTVKTTSGTFQGFNNGLGIEAWIGLRYGQAPEGSLRFLAPVPITKPPSGVQSASTFGNACPQPDSDSLGAPQAEDCLFLNVFRPEGTKSDSKLPILFWIHGGQYTSGAASNPQFDPTVLVSRSVAIGKPIIFVSTNYRLNTFGFLASADNELKNLNAGLQDQQLSLQFVKENIENFGGDSSKVTIWGQSAGAGSVEAHLLYPAKESLFRAAIADSSTGPFKSAPFPFQYDAPGKPFAELLAQTGCSAGAGAIACLQKVPFETLRTITNNLIAGVVNGQLWQPTIAPGSLCPERPSVVINSGNFLKVPYIGGTNLNEGTVFSTSVFNVSHLPSQEDTLFGDFIGDLILDSSTLTSDVLNTIFDLYPANDPNQDAPFNTGDSLFDRSAAWYGDTFFLAPRRFFFDRAADKMQMFAYHFREFLPGESPTDGVAHASELGLLFGFNTAASELEFANLYRDAYINFINDLNPGEFWPTFDPNDRKVLQLKKNNVTLIPDTFNLEMTNFLNEAKVLNEFEK